MKPRHFLLPAILLLLVFQASVLQARAAPPLIEKQASLHASASQIEVIQDGDGVRIQGVMRRHSSSPSRRLYGKVGIQALDAQGRSLFNVRTDLSRVGGGKHTARARFSLYQGAVRAEQISRLKIGYLPAGK